MGLGLGLGLGVGSAVRVRVRVRVRLRVRVWRLQPEVRGEAEEVTIAVRSNTRVRRLPREAARDILQGIESQPVLRLKPLQQRNRARELGGGLLNPLPVLPEVLEAPGRRDSLVLSPIPSAAPATAAATERCFQLRLHYASLLLQERHPRVQRGVMPRWRVAKAGRPAQVANGALEARRRRVEVVGLALRRHAEQRLHPCGGRRGASGEEQRAAERRGRGGDGRWLRDDHARLELAIKYVPKTAPQ